MKKFGVRLSNLLFVVSMVFVLQCSLLMPHGIVNAQNEEYSHLMTLESPRTRALMERKYNLIKTLQSPIPIKQGNFGGDIALSGEHLLIGETGAQVEDNIGAGRAYIFDSNWNLIQSITSPTPEKYEGFSRSVDIQGNLVVVSSHENPVGDLEYAGKVHVFDTSGALLYSLQSPQPIQGCRFGREVAIGNGVLLMGHCPNNPCKGTVCVYDLEETYLTTLITPSSTWNGFGEALSANEEYVLIGEPRSRGGVYVYDYGWGLVKKLQSPYPQNNTDYGKSVAISENHIVVGEMGATVNGHEKAGRAYIYDTEWNLVATLQSPTPEDNAEFGLDVGIGGDLVVVGEGKGDVTAMSEGKVYVYNLEGNLLDVLVSPEPKTGAQFGWKVLTDGEIVVVSEVDAIVDGVFKAGRVHIFGIGEPPVEAQEPVEETTSASEEEPEAEPVRGIPGYTVETIVIGVTTVILYAYTCQKKGRLDKIMKS